MKLKSALDEFYTASATVSSLTRQLSLSGIAILWVFFKHDDGNIIIPELLRWPVILILLSLVADLVQYVFKASVWGWFKNDRYRKGYNEDEDLREEDNPPPWYNVVALAIFCFKIVFMVIAYGIILYFLVTTSTFT